MDTKLMEYTAEDLIAHKLQRAGILVLKPKFDRDGADLIGLLAIDDNSKFCRIQCKGRSLNSASKSFIDIPTKYVTKSFIVFLYIDEGKEENTNLYIFFHEDIIKWKENKKKYTLRFSKSRFKEKLKDNYYSSEKVKKVEEIINNSNAKNEIFYLNLPISENKKISSYNNILYDGLTDTTTTEIPRNGKNAKFDPELKVWTSH